MAESCDAKLYMGEAIKEALKAYSEAEVPVGCVIVRNGEIIARAHNRKISENNSLCHAELIALNAAQKILGSKYLEDCRMFVTAEPCAMCAGAIINTRLGELNFAIREPKTGCCGSVCNLLELGFNHRVRTVEGEMRDEALRIMQDFFRERRGKCS